MGTILEQAERSWAGDEQAHPFTPSLELEEVAPGVAFLSSFANVAVIRGASRIALVDTGTWLLAGQQFDRVRAYDPNPVSRVLFTHGHVDHVMGLGPFDEEATRRGWEPLRVIAHEAIAARFDRYRRTAGYNGRINARQFGIPVQWPTRYRLPDETYRDACSLDLEGERLDLFHGKGETDDHTWAFLPSRRALFTGDLFIWASPNAGNPQKVQRFPGEWAQALRKMSQLQAEVLCPGHGPPILGAARVRRALDETAEFLESLCAQTLAMMNEGATLDDILHAVKPPAHLEGRPYLRPVYDEPAFIVRNLWRQYGGWYDGNPAHLKPAPEALLARELAALAGGAHRLAERALQLAADGDLPLASHLAEFAWKSSPEDPHLAATRRQIYARRSEAETSLMARSIFRRVAEGEP